MRSTALHYRFGYDRDYVAMTGRNSILRYYFRGGRTVEDDVVIVGVNPGFFNPAAQQCSFVPLRVYWVALIRSSQFNLNIIQPKTGRNYVHGTIVKVTPSQGRVENDFAPWESVLRFNEISEDLINYAAVVDCPLPPCSPKAENRQAALVVHIYEENSAVVESRQSGSKVKR